MSFAEYVTIASGHVRFASRDAVIDALFRMGIARGACVTVWPPRRLPHGLFISPARGGWISVWTPLGNLHEWFPELTATLECPGILLEVIESEIWSVEFYQDGRSQGRYALPSETVEMGILQSHAEASLDAEGNQDPEEDQVLARMEELSESDAYLEDVEEYRQERPDPEVLDAYLPAHATIETAWEILTAIEDRTDDSEEANSQAEDYMEAFARYLGIPDAAWEPFADAEAFAEGDYEDEEGLPEGWREFVVLPIPQLPVL